MSEEDRDWIVKWWVYPNCNDTAKIQVKAWVKIGALIIPQRFSFAAFNECEKKISEIVELAYNRWMELNQEIENLSDKIDFAESSGALSDEELEKIEKMEKK